MAVNVIVPVQTLRGRRMIAERPKTSWGGKANFYNLTGVAGRQTIAQGDTFEELREWALDLGAESVTEI